MKGATSAGRMPANVSEKRPRDGDGGIGERRRGGEPVGRRYVEADRCCDSGRIGAQRQQDGEHEPERRNRFRQPLRGAGAHLGRELQDVLVEHAVRDEHAERCRPRSAPPGSRPRRAGAISPLSANTAVTAGLKWAPEIGPNMVISTTSMAPVASVLPSRASATLPPARRSPMMPEPMTVASSRPVPRASAANRRDLMRPSDLATCCPRCARSPAGGA